MKESSGTADFIACVAILITVISGSLNFHFWSEMSRLSDINQKQAAQIQTMERTLLMTK